MQCLSAFGRTTTRLSAGRQSCSSSGSPPPIGVVVDWLDKNVSLRTKVSPAVRVPDGEAQRRWIEYSESDNPTTGTYRLVPWDSIVAVHFARQTRPDGAFGEETARLFIVRPNGQVRSLGVVPKQSPSLVQLHALLAAQKNRWVRMWRAWNGAHHEPRSGEGFADLRQVTAINRNFGGIDTGGRPCLALLYPGIGEAGCVVDDVEQARVRAMIDNNMTPTARDTMMRDTVVRSTP